MKDALNLLTELIDTDVDWLCSRAHERQVIMNTRVITEGEPPKALYIVLNGLLRIQVAALGDRVVGTLGPGEMVGDIAFLQGCPASATVVAAENSLLLAVPVELLTRRLLMDNGFAARMYRSMALTSQRRLLERVGQFGGILRQVESLAHGADSPGARVQQAVDEFLAFMQSADQAALKNGGQLPSEVFKEMPAKLMGFVRLVNGQMGEAAAISPTLPEELGRRVQRAILPYVLLSQTGERWYAKPRGYAGDYLTIELIYRNQPQGVGRLGAAIDNAFLLSPPCQAARNRRPMVKQLILDQAHQQAERPVRITSLACGPAREVFDALSALPDPDALQATLIDIDAEALAYVKELQKAAGYEKQIRLEAGNLVYLALGRQQLDLSNQDFVYSIGLIDYFDDKFVIRLLDYIHKLLRPGGKAVLGNFHPRNVTKVFMDHVFDWRLIHRTESDMNRLFSESAFGQPCTAIHFEEEQINLFAECIKQ